MPDHEFAVVVSGPCLTCRREMSEHHPGVMCRRTAEPDRYVAAPLCYVCIDAAMTALFGFWEGFPPPPFPPLPPEGEGGGPASAA